MIVEALKKRRLTLLKELACKAKGRHDFKLALSEVAPSLDLKGFAGGTKFVDSETPTYEGSSDLAYDFNTLHEEGFIQQTYLNYEQDSMGSVVRKNPAVRVTNNGFEAVVEASKSWLKRAIEQQPMTFLQIIVTVVIAIVTGIGGWAIGRYITPVERQKQAVIQQSVSREEPVTGGASSTKILTFGKDDGRTKTIKQSNDSLHRIGNKPASW
ncbi:MAG: hypothetical protein ABSB79_11055 [Syntrophales bacterium]|jgi:hypothetical protein